MKTLLILRHAKSSWDNADLSDFERPLNQRGLEAAPLMGNFMDKNQLFPALILSSPARRAAQTALIIKDKTRIKGEIIFNHRIYEASPARLLDVIGEQDETVETILLVGHNPGLEGLIKILTGDLQPMPTAGLAVIDLEINKWSDINTSTGSLRMLIRPKEIEENGKWKTGNG